MLLVDCVSEIAGLRQRRGAERSERVRWSQTCPWSSVRPSAREIHALGGDPAAPETQSRLTGAMAACTRGRQWGLSAISINTFVSHARKAPSDLWIDLQDTRRSCSSPRERRGAPHRRQNKLESTSSALAPEFVSPAICTSFAQRTFALTSLFLLLLLFARGLQRLLGRRSQLEKKER